MLVIFVCAGAAFVVPANWSPFLPESEVRPVMVGEEGTGRRGEEEQSSSSPPDCLLPAQGLGVYGVSGIFRGASVLAFRCVGDDGMEGRGIDCLVAPPPSCPVQPHWL